MSRPPGAGGTALEREAAHGEVAVLAAQAAAVMGNRELAAGFAAQTTDPAAAAFIGAVAATLELAEVGDQVADGQLQHLLQLREGQGVAVIRRGRSDQDAQSRWDVDEWVQGFGGHGPEGPSEPRPQDRSVKCADGPHDNPCPPTP